MKRILALGLVAALFVTVCDVPAFSEPALNENSVYREYRDSIFRLQQDVVHLYLELQQGKNPQAVYEHILQVTEQIAVLIGKAELASKEVDDALQISLQDYMEMLLLLGLPEDRKSNLMSLGYTEEDIAELMDWILHYNDYNHHIITGFSPEEMERFYAA